MKIAVLSDIHGNIEALKAVLKDIESQEINRLYILGDLAFCGPKPRETLDYIISNLSKHIIIQGNTDEMIVKATGDMDDPYTPKKEIMANALKYAQEVLDEDHKLFLANLPPQHYEEIGGLKILFVHGSPRKNDEGIYQKVKFSKLKEMVEDTDANLIFCGHTHYPVIHVVDNVRIVNDGSVGRPFEDNVKAVYAILDLTEVEERKYTIEHRYVPYDYEIAANDLEKCSFDGSDILADMLRLGTDVFPDATTVY